MPEQRTMEVYKDGKLVGTEAYMVSDEEVAAQALANKIAGAIATNKTFLALPDYPASPTTAQRDAAIRALLSHQRALTRQMNAVLRLRAGMFDDASDT